MTQPRRIPPFLTKTAGFLRVEHKIKSRFQVVIKWLQVYHPGYTSTKIEKSS